MGASVRKVFVIGVNHDLNFEENISEVREGFVDSEEFFIGNGIVEFDTRKLILKKAIGFLSYERTLSSW